MKKPNSRRAINVPGNDIGKRRQRIYAAGFRQLSSAISAGYYIEAIALCESLLSDRLEARRAWLARQQESKREFGTLGGLARKLLGQSSKEAGDPIEGNKVVYEDCIKWADDRNKAIHEMFKLAEGDESNWEVRYAALEAVAASGLKLTRKLSAAVKKSNTPKERGKSDGAETHPVAMA